jgi:6-phosphogluconolactonase (cycloisomerase 2 family)
MNRTQVCILSFALYVILLSSSCGSGGSSSSNNNQPPSSPQLVSISVAPGTPSLPLGNSQQFTATGTYSDTSTKNLSSSVTWSSSSTAVAAIDSTGLAISKGQGTSTITATSGTISGNTLFTVTAPALVSITVAPSTPSLPLGNSQRFTATGIYSDQSTQNLSSVSWSSSSTAIATIDTTGLATSKSQGTSTITASSGPISGSTLFTITAPTLVSLAVTVPGTLFVGVPQRATAIGTFTDGSQQDVTSTAIWTTGKPFVATVDSAGIVTPVTAGMNTVSANIGAVSAFASFLDLATPRYIYASSSHSDGLSVLTVDPQTSQMRNIPYKPLGNGVFPTGVAVHPTKPWVYVLEAGSKQVTALSVGVNGSLSFISGGPFSTGDTPTAITIDPAGEFLFVANAGSSDTVSAFSIDQNSGMLTAVAGSPFPAGSAPSALLVHPSGNFLYVANRLGSTVSAYSIDSSSGALTSVGAPLATVANPLAITSDPSGNYVYVGGTTISAYSVSPTTGALTAVAGSPFGIIGTFTESLAVDVTGKYLYAGDLVYQTIQEFAISVSTGALAQITGSPLTTCNNPNFLAPDPSGKYLYVSCAGLSAVWAYQIDSSSGTLTKSAQVGILDALTGMAIASGASPVTLASTKAYATNAANQTISIFSIDPTQHTITANGTATVSSPTSLAIDWLDKFLYSADSMSSSITRSLVQPDGSLTSPLSITPIGPGAFPEALAIDPSQRWVFAPENNGYLAMFYLDPVSGLLTPNSISAPGGQLPLSGNPVAAIVQPSGQTLYVANFGSNLIQAFNIDLETGALIQNYKAPYIAGANPTALAIDPSGRFLYAANFGSNDISAYLIAPGLNNLVPVSTTTFPVGPQPIALVVDGSGNFLYVANKGDGTISAFRIDGTSGALTALPNSPFGGSGASSMALDASGRYLYVTSQSAPQTSTYQINADGSLTLLGIAPTGVQTGAIVTNSVVQ